MSESQALIVGEFSRNLDERFRLTLPDDLLTVFQPKDGNCVLAKEGAGHLSLWDQEIWQEKMEEKINFIRDKMKAHKLDDQQAQLQSFGRLLSARQRPVQLADKGRILLPEGFREFLKVEKKGELMIVGAAICIEIWNPETWVSYVEQNIPDFNTILNTLSS